MTQEQGLELKSKTFPGKIAQSSLEPSTFVIMVLENGARYPICIFTHVPYIHVLTYICNKRSSFHLRRKKKEQPLTKWLSTKFEGFQPREVGSLPWHCWLKGNQAEAIFTKVCRLLRYLHKESSHKCLPDVHIIITTVEVCAASCKVESFHDSGELLSYIVCWLERPLLNKVIIAPLDIFMVWKKRTGKFFSHKRHPFNLLQWTENQQKKWEEAVSLNGTEYM